MKHNFDKIHGTFNDHSESVKTRLENFVEFVINIRHQLIDCIFLLATLICFIFVTAETKEAAVQYNPIKCINSKLSYRADELYQKKKTFSCFQYRQMDGH